LKILLEKPFRPRPSADGFANWFVNGFAIGGLDRFPLPPRRTNWKPVEKSIGKPMGTKRSTFKPGAAAVRRANSYRFRDVLGRFCRAGGGCYEMIINIKSRSAKKTAFNVCI
jgi:hypothetical protein